MGHLERNVSGTDRLTRLRVGGKPIASHMLFVLQRDSEATRRVGAMLRFLAPFTTSPDWEPHVILNLPIDSNVSLFASRLPSAAGIFASHNATAWMLVNRGSANVTTAPLVFVPCSGVSIFDVYAGLQV